MHEQTPQRRTSGNYPLPGTETFYHTTVKDVPGFTARQAYTWANGAPDGPKLFKIVHDNLLKHSVEIRLNSPAAQLVSNPETRGLRRRVESGTRIDHRTIDRACLVVDAKVGRILPRRRKEVPAAGWREVRVASFTRFCQIVGMSGPHLIASKITTAKFSLWEAVPSDVGYGSDICRDTLGANPSKSATFGHGGRNDRGPPWRSSRSNSQPKPAVVTPSTGLIAWRR